MKSNKADKREDVSAVRVSVPWHQISELRSSLTTAAYDALLKSSDELYISVKNSRNGLILSFQNYNETDLSKSLSTEDGASISEKSSVSPDTIDHTPSNVKAKRNYLNVIDVFSLPEYKDQSIQCDLETYDVNGRFVSSMYFHPFHLKLGRHVKCIQCKFHVSTRSPR